MVNQEHWYCIKQNLCSLGSRQLGLTKWKMEMEDSDQKVLVPPSFLELVQRIKLSLHSYLSKREENTNQDRVVTWCFWQMNACITRIPLFNTATITLLCLYEWILDSIDFQKYKCEKKNYMWKFEYSLLLCFYLILRIELTKKKILSLQLLWPVSVCYICGFSNACKTNGDYQRIWSTLTI